MSDLTEALVRNEEVFGPTWEESLLFADAARKWADLETLVADGGRVVVEKRCVHGQIVHKWHPSEQVRLQLSDGCEGGESRVVLGEGAE